MNAGNQELRCDLWDAIKEKEGVAKHFTEQELYAPLPKKNTTRQKLMRFYMLGRPVKRSSEPFLTNFQTMLRCQKRWTW